MLERLFGGRAKKAASSDVVAPRPSPLPANCPPGWEKGDAWRAWESPSNLIAGESHHEAAFKNLAGPVCDGGYLMPVTVRLRRDPTNTYDHNAIVAEVKGQVVGFVRKEAAAELSPILDRDGCPEMSLAGLIRGGATSVPNFGVHVWTGRRVSPSPDLARWTTPVPGWPPSDTPSDDHSGWNPTLAGQEITGRIIEIGGGGGTAPSVIVLETKDGPVPVVMSRTVLRSEWERCEPPPRVGDVICIAYLGVVEARDASHTYHKYHLSLEFENDPDKAEAFLRNALAKGPREVSSLQIEAMAESRLPSRALTRARKTIGAEIMHVVPGMEGNTFWGLPGAWPPGTQKKKPRP